MPKFNLKFKNQADKKEKNMNSENSNSNKNLKVNGKLNKL